MNQEDIVSGLILELRRGTLILLVLSRLKEPKYGYSLVKELGDSGIPVEANTLYPLMRRLEGQGLLQSEWETTEAKPRKYYSLTADGEAVLVKMKQCWREYEQSVDRVIGADGE